MARIAAVLLCVAGLVVLAQAGKGSSSSSSQTIVDVLPSTKGVSVGKADSPKYPGDCVVKCKEKCDINVVTKCKVESIDYQLCEDTPIKKTVDDCKQVCEEPSKGITVLGATKGRRLMQSSGKASTASVSIQKDNVVVSSSTKICKKVCTKKEVDDVKTTCKPAKKDKETCTDEEEKSNCKNVCKCVVQNSSGININKSFPVQVNKGSQPDYLFKSTATINTGKGL